MRVQRRKLVQLMVLMASRSSSWGTLMITQNGQLRSVGGREGSGRRTVVLLISGQARKICRKIRTPAFF